jgi:PKD repeat protein
MRLRRVSCLAFALSLSLAAAAALLLALDPRPVLAATTTRYVAPGGDCGGATPCYGTLQSAIDAAAAGDEIKIGQGTYTSTDFQVAYISQAITLTGGFTTTDWTVSHPLTQPSIINAQQVSGRRGVVVQATGGLTVTLDGLTVRSGNTPGDGGGIQILTGTAVLRHNLILTNTAGGNGAGLYMTGTRLVLLSNTLALNDGFAGGGAYLNVDNLLAQGNVVDQNRGQRMGGGLHIAAHSAEIADNTLTNNRTWWSTGGGGLYLSGGTILAANNIISRNTTVDAHGNGGGGVFVATGTVTLSDNVIAYNTTVNANGGGGVLVANGTVTLSGNIIEYNLAQAGTDSSWGGGGGVRVDNGVVTLARNQINNNRLTGVSGPGNSYQGPGGGGLRVQFGQVVVTDNVIADNAAHNSDNIGNCGGGISVMQAAVLISGNAISNNLSGYGGGICLFQFAWLTTTHNLIQANRVFTGGPAYGGGIYNEGHLHMTGDQVLSNTSTSGGGFYFGDTTWISGVVAAGNIATQHGGGADAGFGGWVYMTNTQFVGNSAGVTGGGLVLRGIIGTGDNVVVAGNTALFEGIYAHSGTIFELRHATLADNGNYAVHVSGATVYITNAIVATHTNGAFYGSGLTADTVLLHNTGTACGGGAACSNTISGDPRFADPAGRDYRLGAGSDAVDAALDLGLAYDLEGDPRPYGSAPDLGADEQLPAPVAGFGHSAPGWVGQVVAFTNTTQVSGTARYTWVFGDGGVSALASPTHTFAAPGIYPVVMTAANPAGFSVVTATVAIYGPAFEANTPSWLGHTTLFTHTGTTTGTTSYHWGFGDGDVSALESPTHTYAAPGIFSVTLALTNPAGTAVTATTITVFGLPETGFQASAGWIGEALNFTNTTSVTPTDDPTLSYVWDFGDGATSALLHLAHAYAGAGLYTVTLTATNLAGQGVATATVEVYPPPTASFISTSPDWLGQTTVFTNLTTGPTPITYAWEFGDGGFSTLESPAHAYATPGTYTVTLTAGNPSGVSVLTNTFTLSAPTVAFSASVVTITEGAGSAALTVTLSAGSEATVTVPYSTTTGTAAPGQDYTPGGGTLTFAPGQVEQVVSVPVVDDTTDELDHDFGVALAAPANAMLGTPIAVVVTIKDDDAPPTVQLSQLAYTTAEWSGAAALTATLSAASELSVTVDYLTTDMTATAAVDYLPLSGTLAFAPGQMAQPILVSVVNDDLLEPVEALSLALAAPTNAALGAPAEAALTILDNEAMVCGPAATLSAQVETALGVVEAIFHGVDGCGHLAITTRAAPGDLPPGFVPLATAYEVTLSNTAFISAVLRLPYQSAEAAEMGVPEASLRVLHPLGAGWLDVTQVLDAEDDVLVAVTDSLSPFVIGAFEIAPCAISINNGAPFTRDRAVRLFSDMPGATEILVSNDAGFTGAAWQAYASDVSWTLSDAGERIVTLLVYARFRDASQAVLCGVGGGGTVLDDIIYDPLPPAATVTATQVVSTAVTAGWVRAGNTVVTVAISAFDQAGGSGVAQMQVSGHPQFLGARWVPFNATAQVVNPLGPFVYVRVRDGVGNVSAPAIALVPGATLYLFLPVLSR